MSASGQTRSGQVLLVSHRAWVTPIREVSERGQCTATQTFCPSLRQFDTCHRRRKLLTARAACPVDVRRSLTLNLPTTMAPSGAFSFRSMQCLLCHTITPLNDSLPSGQTRFRAPFAVVYLMTLMQMCASDGRPFPGLTLPPYPSGPLVLGARKKSRLRRLFYPFSPLPPFIT